MSLIVTVRLHEVRNVGSMPRVLAACILTLVLAVIVTQVPVVDWHSRIPDPTLGDAMLDRLIHSAYRVELKGESMRKLHSPLVADRNQG